MDNKQYKKQKSQESSRYLDDVFLLEVGNIDRALHAELLPVIKGDKHAYTRQGQYKRAFTQGTIIPARIQPRKQTKTKQ